MDGNEMDPIIKQEVEHDSDSSEDTNDLEHLNFNTNSNDRRDVIKTEPDSNSDKDEDIQEEYYSSYNKSEDDVVFTNNVSNWTRSKRSTSQQPRYKSIDEIIRMLVIPIIKEATVLKTDPRHYFQFYTATSKAIDVAIKLNLIHHDQMNDIWIKCDQLAVSIFDAGVIDESYKVVSKKIRRKHRLCGRVKQKPFSNIRRLRQFTVTKLWHGLLDLLKQCKANNVSRLDLGVRRDFFLRLATEVEKQTNTKLKEEFYFAFFTSTVEQLEAKLIKPQIQNTTANLISRKRKTVELTTVVSTSISNENTHTEQIENRKEIFQCASHETTAKKQAKKKSEKEKTKEILTPEERSERRKQYNYFYRQAIKSTLTPEQLEEKRKLARERGARRYTSQSLEMKQLRNEKFKAWESKLTGEKRERHKANQSKAVLKWQHKFKETQPEKYQQHLEKINKRGREKLKNETPEQRQKRLLRLRITSTKHNLVSKLKKEGMGPEEIEETVQERLLSIIEQCKKRMNATDITYNPRPKKKKEEPEPLPPTKAARHNLACAIPSQLVTNAVGTDGVNPTAPEYKAVYRVYENQVVPWKGIQPKMLDSVASCPSSTEQPYSVLQNATTVSISLAMPVFSGTPQIEQSHHTPNSFTGKVPAVESYLMPSSNPQDDALIHIVKPQKESLPYILEDTSVKQNFTQVPSLDLDISAELVEASNHSDNDKTDNTECVVCDECGKLLKPNSIYSHKNNFHNPCKLTHKCPKCSMEFPYARLLWHHLIAVHNTEHGIETLNSEKKNITNTKSWVRYPNDVGGETEPSKQYRGPCVVCDQCGKKYSQKANLDDHIRRVHMGQKYVCNICGVEQQSAGKLWKHKIDRHGIREQVPPGVKELISCEHCGVDVLRSYPTHLKKYHPEKLEKYLIQHPPGKRHRFYNKNLLKNSPSPTKSTFCQKLIECYICLKKIGDKSLARHLRNVHGLNTKSFACDQCGKTFNEHYRLMEHFRMTHLIKDLDRKLVTLNLIKYTEDGNKYLYACALCNHSIESRNDMRSHILAEHMVVFERIKNSKDHVWTCRECSVGFEAEKEFDNHLKSVHPSKQFFCPQPTCLLLFNTAIQLKAHLTHEHPERGGPMYFKIKCSSQRLKECYRCPASFELSSDLKDHVKVMHPNDFFPCPHCSLLWFSERVLHKHFKFCSKNTDKATKDYGGPNSIYHVPIRCTKCPKVVKLSGLSFHMAKAHPNLSDEVICTSCQKHFTQRCSWAIHIENVHGVKIEDVLPPPPTLENNKNFTKIPTIKKVLKQNMEPKTKKRSRRAIQLTNHDLSNDKKQVGRRKRIKIIYKDGSDSDDNKEKPNISIDIDSDSDFECKSVKGNQLSNDKPKEIRIYINNENEG